MKIVVERKWKKAKYTIGRIFIDGELYGNTLEDTDRGLTQSTPLSDIKKIKVYSQTAIPIGTYEVTLNVISPKFSQKQFYKDNANGGRLPRLLNVPGFDGILIHVGDGVRGPELTAGCILVGLNTIVGGLTNGQETFKKIYKKLKSAKDKITIEIK